MTNNNLNEIIEAARLHAERLTADVALATTRIEHVRVTARANEAVHLLHSLEELKTNDTVTEVN